MNEFAPTKTNLQKAKRMLAFAKSSFTLLDRKRKVLIQELLERIEKSKRDGELLQSELEEFYQYVRFASITYGSENVESLSQSFPKVEEIETLSTSVMGVSLQRLFVEDTEASLRFGMYRTGKVMDEIVQRVPELRKRLFAFVEEENAVSRLAQEIKRTEKRVNSIEKVQIPKYTRIVQRINEALEEKDREDLFRLKVVKKKKERNLK
ncbi:V-type ATP synthase subunit D [Guggenheimella bovis]